VSNHGSEQGYSTTKKIKHDAMATDPGCKLHMWQFWENMAQGGLSVAGRCRCLTKDSNTSIEKEGYIPYSLQA